MAAYSLKKLDAPWATALIVAAAYCVFLWLRLNHNGFDPSRFITAGDRYVDERAAPAAIYVEKDGDGYDGQFYFRLALNPFATVQTYKGIRFDRPAYRQQRILYPAIVWALALGNQNALPALMIGVNYAALCAIGWLAGTYTQLKGRHALLGLSAPLYPGFLLCLSRDTAEIVMVGLILCGMVLIEYQHTVAAALCLLAATLTKETALVCLLVYGIGSLRRPGKQKLNLPAFGVVLMIVFVWQVLLFFTWHTAPIMSGGSNIGMPLVGLSRFIAGQIGWRSHLNIIWSVELVLLAIFSAVTLTKLRENADRKQSTLFVAYLCLALTLNTFVWVDDWAFLRATSELFLFGMVILLQASRTAGLATLCFTAGMWVYLGLNIVYAR